MPCPASFCFSEARRPPVLFGSTKASEQPQTIDRSRSAPLKNKKKVCSGWRRFYKQATPTGFEGKTCSTYKRRALLSLVALFLVTAQTWATLAAQSYGL